MPVPAGGDSSVWAPDYAELAGLKAYLRIEDTADDTFLALWITAVSRNVDDHCGRQFGSVAAEERWYDGVWDRHLATYVHEIDDVFDVSALTAQDSGSSTVAAADYTLWPRNAPQKGQPYTQLRTAAASGLTLNAPWGWPGIPSSITTALYLQAARLAARRDSPFGISGSPSEQGEIRLLAQLDPDFRVALKPFVRKWWAA